MSNYLSYTEILKKCELLNEQYEINQDYFSNIIDELINSELSSDEVIMKGFQDLLTEVNSEINRMEQKVDMTPSCFKGCAFCCYFPIIVTKLEAKIMFETIESWPEERKTAISNHFDAYFKKYGDTLKSLTELDFENDPDTKHKYISEQVPCPMLDTKENTCLAYELRPIPCRTYLNYGDPKVCKDELVPKEPFSFEFLYEFYMGSLNELIQELYENGEELFVNYPEDIWAYNYLPTWIEEWRAK